MIRLYNAAMKVIGKKGHPMNSEPYDLKAMDEGDLESTDDPDVMMLDQNWIRGAKLEE